MLREREWEVQVMETRVSWLVLQEEVVCLKSSIVRVCVCVLVVVPGPQAQRRTAEGCGKDAEYEIHHCLP